MYTVLSPRRKYFFEQGPMFTTLTLSTISCSQWKYAQSQNGLTQEQKIILVSDFNPLFSLVSWWLLSSEHMINLYLYNYLMFWLCTKFLMISISTLLSDFLLFLLEDNLLYFSQNSSSKTTLKTLEIIHLSMATWTKTNLNYYYQNCSPLLIQQ